ncbi:AAA family ATPase [Reticulibacter mediterranei]|nr:AAA family ATPase [Reticulibacter mediterranei]
MSGERKDPPAIIVPQRSLVVLSGPAGAGKSTFALRVIQCHSEEGFRPTMIVSSDQCRALVSDDENNQQANRDTFDLFHYIIFKRMLQNRFTIADSTALQPEARHRLLSLAARHSYHTCLLIFDIPPEICAHRDKQRNRLVGEQVITFHNGLLQRVIQEAPGEGWDQVHILRDEDLSAQIEITRNS